MKTGFLYALVTWLGTGVLLFLLSFVVEAIWSVRFEPYHLGEIVGRIALFLAFVAFIVGWIRQANRKGAKPAPAAPQPAPENLQPIDYSKLSSLYDDPKA